MLCRNYEVVMEGGLRRREWSGINFVVLNFELYFISADISMAHFKLTTDQLAY